jgi:hypothetical protein
VRISAAEVEAEAGTEASGAGRDSDEAEAAPVRAVAGDGAITRPSQLLDTVLAPGARACRSRATRGWAK